MRISIEHYIATNNEDGAQDVLSKYGVTKAKDLKDLIKKMRIIMTNHKEPAVKDFANLDTDYRRMILASIEQPEPVVVPESKSNACGCSGFDGEQKSNCSGCEAMSNCSGDESKSNCSGCGGTCGGKNKEEKTSSATGDVAPVTTPAATSPVTTPIITPEHKESYMPLMIFGTITVAMVVFAAIAFKK